MKRLLFLCFALVTTCAVAGKLIDTDINSALKQAKAENKILFLLCGRDNCENCQALRGMIGKNKVLLPDSKFVCADVNIDNRSNKKSLAFKFKVEGDVLPLVVIAGPDGKQLAAHSGPGTAEDFNKLIQTASAKIAKP